MALQQVKWTWPNGQHEHVAIGVLSFNADTRDYRVTRPTGSMIIIPRACSVEVQDLAQPALVEVPNGDHSSQ